MEAWLVKFQSEIPRLYQDHLLFLIMILPFWSVGADESAMVNKRAAPLK